MDRLRWDNIAKALAVLAVIVLVVAWPHLKGKSPALPAAAATPVTVEDPAASAPPVPTPTPAKPPRRRAKAHRPGRPPRPARHVVAKRPAPKARPTEPARAKLRVAPTPPAPRPRAPSPGDIAAHEFAVP